MTAVTSAGELLDALATADDIEIDGTLSGLPAITLRPGTRLRGGTLRFGAKGIRLTSDNQLEDVTVIVPGTEVTIGTSAADLGHLTLRNIITRGQVLLTPSRGRVEVDGLTVASADLRGREERPRGFGVDAMQGAFTLWNRSDAATLTGISAGAAGAPVRGSGVFVAGPVEVDLLRTGPVVTLEAAGTVGELKAGEIAARGVGSDAVRVSGSGSVGGLDSVTVTGPVRRQEALT